MSRIISSTPNMLTRLGKLALITLLFSLLFSLTTSANAYVWYVDASQGVSGNGTSWFEAFKTIQEAVPKAVGSDEIWVKKGVYPLTSTITLDMKMISIYGGFIGWETDPSQRDLKNNTSTIDGQNLHRVFYVYYGKPRIDGFTITRGKSGPSYNPDDFMGGAIYFDRCRDLVPVVINCVFTGNVAERVGGAIANYDSSPYIINSSFSGNLAWGNGGAIYNDGAFSIPIITNCTFTNNQATGQVGGWDAGYGDDIYSRPGTNPSINNSIIWGNPWGNSIVGPINVTYSDVNQDGFAGINGNIRQDPLLAGSGKFRLRPGSPCIDTGNNTAFPYPWYPVITDYFGNDRIIDGDANETATIDMGAHEYVPGEVVGTWYVDGAAPPSGNGSSWDQAFRTIGEAVTAAADGNDIYVRAGVYGPVSVSKALNFYGGYEGVTTIDAQNMDGWYGFNISNTSVSIYGFTITRTKASGIHSLNSSLTVTNIIFTANSSGQGGGIDILNGPGATISNCTFTGNSASFAGGAIRAIGTITGQINVNNSTFTNNHAAHEGGAIFSSAASAPLIFNNCTFTNNSSDYMGGAIYSTSPLTLTNSTFTGNSGTQGGGAVYNTGSSTITGCTFRNNSAGAYSSGGAIFNQSGTHSVSTSRFLGNTAGENGGGINDGNTGNLTVLTSIFAGNRANGSYGMGGGIRVYQGTTGAVTILNSSFYGNYAASEGGGLHLGELSGTCSRYRVYNSILWGNSATQYKETGTTPEGCPSIYQYSNIDQANYSSYSHNIRQNPLFINIAGTDPSAWDFHLQPGSPSIDVGSNTVPGLPLYDIDGEPRIMDGNGDTGAITDMGVDEVTGPQDTTPPSGTILINSGDPFTSNWNASLKFNVTDPSGMNQMCVSNTISCSSWEPFIANKDWTLPAGDGVKTVYGWFRDFFGNMTAAPITDTIIVDTESPIDGTVTATPGINSIVVTWSGFSDAASGINAYIVKARDDQYPTSCDDGVLWYEGLDTTVNYGANSQRYIRVCARDNLWHVSPGVTATATPEIDVTPPTGSILINNGEAYTNQPSVILTISASDPSGVSAYCISYTPTCPWGNWQPYPSPYPIGWSLYPFVDGVHTVYAFFYDMWGNGYSTVHSDTIIVDTVLPTVTAFAIPATSSSSTIPITTFTATDNVAVSDYCLTDYNYNYGCTWTSTAPTSFKVSGGGNITIYAWARDVAGNIASASANINVTKVNLSVTLAGSGSGEVSSNPPGLSCTSGTCSGDFTLNSLISLQATPSIDSMFSGWSGYCSGNGDCYVFTNGSKTVTATFDIMPARLNRATPLYFPSLQAAYNAADDGDVIQLKEGELVGPLNANRPIALSLKGGYNASYDTVSSNTRLQGTITISLGSLTINRVFIVSDNIQPTVTDFWIPPTSDTLTIPIYTFTATDNVAISGYCLTEINSSNGCVWTTTAPTSFTVSGVGNITIYAWVRDAAGNIASSSANITVSIIEVTLSVSLAGSGSGAVNSDPPGLSCTSGTCSSDFTLNSWVSLLATPSIDSIFSGWSGYCSGSGDCSVFMGSVNTVTATFNLLPPARLNRPTPLYFPTLQAAYNAADDGDVIQLKEGELVGSLNANRSIAISLKGGYNASYDTVSSNTLLQGTITISLGSLTVDRVIIRQQ